MVQSKPFRVTEDMVYPLLAVGSFQPPGKTKEVCLFHDVAGGGSPDVIQDFGSCA